ncbi:MAG: site-specific tyrosine recombinase/integron integrase [Thermoplasmata archaeon]
MTDVITKFRNYLMGEKKSMNTVKTYVSIVKNFLNFVNNENIEEINMEDIERYKEYLSVNKNMSKQTIYITMKALQSFFKFLKREDLIKLNTPKRSRKLPTYLNEMEMSLILEKSMENLRDHVILMTLAFTGLRVSELVSLNVEDIDFYENIIHVKSGKGDKDRIVVLDSAVLDLIKEYLKGEKRLTGPVFISRKKVRITTTQIERIVKKYVRMAGINKKVTPHTFRHTFATTLLRNGADIRFIQQLLGHSSIATTQIYTHVDENALKDVYMKAKPKYLS